MIFQGEPGKFQALGHSDIFFIFHYRDVLQQNFRENLHTKLENEVTQRQQNAIKGLATGSKLLSTMQRRRRKRKEKKQVAPPSAESARAAQMISVNLEEEGNRIARKI